MKIRILLDFDERQRRAISHHVGKDHPATRDECINFINACVDPVMDDLLVEYDRDTEEEKADEN